MKLLSTTCLSVSITVLSIRSLKNSMSSGQLLQHVAEDPLQEPLGQVHVVGQSSKKATSGSTIQNSARCRGVLEFSARKVGPKV